MIDVSVPLMLGKYELRPPVSDSTRMSIALWGPSGCGKSTIAATAPGKKLFLMWDDEGAASLGHRKDVHVIELFKDTNSAVETFKQPNPLNIEKLLKENEDIGTIVFDSITTFGERALVHGVGIAAGTKKGEKSTLEDPGYAGYGIKNTWTHLAVSNLLASTARYRRHIIFIAHEGVPDKDKDGNAISISMLLGSTLSKEVPIKFSEVWAMYDTGSERRLAIRPSRMRTPMKTRMFDTSVSPEFVLDYDVLKDGDEFGISGWYDAWRKNGFSKIPLPKVRKK